MSATQVVASEPSNRNGYRSFRLGKFELSRDEYFVTIHWPAKGARRSHQMAADASLRACMRDVAWNFFYGWVNFDHVIGTRNRYGKVDFYAGTFNGTLKAAGVDYLEQFGADHIMAHFWTTTADAADVDAGRHCGRANYTFVDGHAVCSDLRDTFEPARSRDAWNPQTAQ